MPSLRTKQRKGSIVITVLILMVVSSFLVILTMRYVLSMLQGFTSLTNYYKAYYVARGGMDVLLTQHAYRGRGYETDVSSNLADMQCFGNCSLEGSITSRFPRIDTSINPTQTGCAETQAITVLPGQSSIYALFSDEYALPTFFKPLNSLIDYQTFPNLQNVTMHVYGLPAGGDLYWYDSRDGAFGRTYYLDSVISGAPINGEYIKQNLLTSVPNRAGIFLLVNNPSKTNKAFSYCFEAPNKNMIGQTNIIRTSASVQDAYVTLETIKTNRFPSILIQ